jgi:alpha-tubulin suppressor-like RCC1 family protein
MAALVLAAGAGCTWLVGVDKDYELVRYAAGDDASNNPDDASDATATGDTSSSTTDGGADADASLLLEPIAIDVHFDLSCALLSNGRVRCWGPNEFLQAGAEEDAGTVVAKPVEVKGITDAIAVSAGFDHACALRQGGKVMCWGGNDYGQLGRSIAETTIKSATPFEVAGLPANDPVRAISAGAQYTCALTNSARIFCWGTGMNGAIFEQDAAAPVPPKELVMPNQSTPLFVAVRAEQFHTCAVASSGGSTYCWGENHFEQLGRDTAGVSGENPPLEGPPLGQLPATLVTGQTHTCRHSAQNGLYCFGSNLFGQRGRSIPISTQKFIPSPIPGLDTASGATVGAAAGTLITCVTRADGTVACVGSNSNRQLGDPTLDGGAQLDPIKVLGLTDAIATSAGASHVCALRKGGGAKGGKSVVCWGLNHFGQLGSSLDGGTATPMPVIGLD